MKDWVLYNWKLIPWAILITVSCVVILLFSFQRDKNISNTSEKVLKTCQEIIANKTDVNLFNITPKIVPVGPAVQYGQLKYQQLVLWESDAFKVEVKCFARTHKTLNDAVIDKLIVNGEDLTSLVRRKERKK